jgi:hypothetical protein
MKSRERVKFVKLFNKKIKEGISLVMTIDNGHDIIRIKNRISTAMEINETIFLDKIGPILLKQQHNLNAHMNSVDLLDNNQTLKSDISSIDDVDDNEKTLFIQLFKKINNMASYEDKHKAVQLIHEMISIYDNYKTMG